MSDEINVKINAKIAGLAAGLAEAQSIVKGGVSEMKGHFNSLNSVIDTVKSHWLGIVTVLGGGKLFHDVIDGTVQWTLDVVQLSKRLGITTEEASGLNVALEHLNISTDEYGTIINKVTRQMRTNEQAFSALGIKTKDQNGQWRNSQDVMADIIEKLNAMKAGTDRNVAAQALMGARVGNITQLLRLNKDMLAESAEKAKAYHLIVGPEGAAKVRSYRDAMADLHLIGTSLKVQIGNALLPVLLKLGQFFGGEGPRLANLFGTVISFVAKAMLGAYAAANALVETVKFLKVLLVTPIGKGWMTTVTAAFHDMGDEIQRVNDEVADAIMRINNPGMVKQKASTIAGSDTLGGDSLKDPKAALKEKWELEQAQFRLEEAQAGENEEKIITIKRAALARARALFGEHSKEYLAAATDLEQELNTGQKEGEKIFADILKDGNEQAKAAMEERKRNWQQLMDGIANAVETSVMGIVQGTTTMSAALKNLFRNILLEYVSTTVKMVIAHKAAELAKTGATVQGTAQRVVLEEWAAVKSVALGAWSAIMRIGQYAVEGAAAAFKAIAAIPIIGPALAPAAAAAAGLAIAGFAGRIASAQGGYDVPSGVNPLTQLHQSEMVLPAELANRVRSMTGAGSGGGLTINVHAMDAKGVKKFLTKHKDSLVACCRAPSGTSPSTRDS
jgi:hypothetical protein